jgi:crotonobetainyl-CoA:carnitine CoA-transferase CaiB-like acyl-CoA transferase
MTQTAKDARPSGPLHGVRVLDFGRYIAGPYCGALLADMGADVIRIEKLGGSEDRFIGPVAPSGEGALFLGCNRGKRGMTLDPMKPQGRDIVQRLVRTADVVIANLPRPSLSAMGVDYDSLSAIRPEIVVVAIDAYGPRGPWADRLGFDGVGQAVSGAMYLSGEPGRPMKTIVNYVDFVTAISATTGVLAALFERSRTGRGRLVEASLLRSALALSNPYLVEQAAISSDRVASANRSQLTGPSDAFETQDGWIIVQVVGRPLFERWAKAVGATELLDDPRFSSDIDRGNHGQILSERMAAWCGTRTIEAVLAAMDAAGVPAAPVLSPRDVLEHPQIVGSGYLVPTPFTSIETPVPLAAAPFGLGEGASIRGPAPALGEHTDAILDSLGFSRSEIAELREGRVV